MSENTPPSPAPVSPAPASSPAPKKKSRWLLYGCGGFLALLLLLFATVAITIWWIQRPIKPVVLSAKEKASVDAKIQQLGGGTPAESPMPAATSSARPNQLEASSRHSTKPGATPSSPLSPEAGRQPDRNYVPGSKVLKLTEREINGLLNANTDLGNTIRLEFARDAINAYLAVPIPQDFPVGGGRMFRARGRFSLSLGNGGAPYAALEDVTVLGLSLPKAWLGGIKGENLLGEAVGGRGRSSVLKGIKSLRIEPGALVLEVED